ncbi:MULTISPECIES: hypothetical protein [Actinomadura]|uniref:Uncharacterized protein n=1 Tax=Actinomadura litoris TaxID=2678616 RepID=A0A7K1KTQ2_9ACTN|nr:MULTISPECIES: hypothetical protein [Actinomadura]MBT2207655.1 hypothetical protein [Actinomadura sp. NEAU-AAG7]MUN35552.1 hypothetical protein [Actinomadura litoris]
MSGRLSRGFMGCAAALAAVLLAGVLLLVVWSSSRCGEAEPGEVQVVNGTGGGVRLRLRYDSGATSEAIPLSPGQAIHMAASCAPTAFVATAPDGRTATYGPPVCPGGPWYIRFPGAESP